MNSPILSLVVPCYNEHDVLPITADILRNKIEYLVSCGKISSKSYIVFVDDGSTDDTWDIIKG